MGLQIGWVVANGIANRLGVVANGIANNLGRVADGIANRLGLVANGIANRSGKYPLKGLQIGRVVAQWRSLVSQNMLGPTVSPPTEAWLPSRSFTQSQQADKSVKCLVTKYLYFSPTMAIGILAAPSRPV